MRNNFKILIAELEDFSKEALILISTLGQVDLIPIQATQLGWAFSQYDVFWFRLGFRISADLLNRPDRRTNIIVCPVTGLDHIDIQTCRELGIKVISLKGENEFLKSVRATAELTLGLTLALLRKIPQAFQSTVAGDWNRDGFRGSEILGKTIGIIGMGRLGNIVADYFMALGAIVVAFDHKDFQKEGIEPADSLKDLLQRADIVSIHVSYDSISHHLLNQENLKHIKKGSILINTSRGGVVDEAALIEALDSGQLAGAALDVIENEHAHHDNPLIAYARKHDNLLITPHIGGNTVESFVKTEVFVANKLKEYLSVQA